MLLLSVIFIARYIKFNLLLAIHFILHNTGYYLGFKVNYVLLYVIIISYIYIQ
jgi:hypothetical protein